MTETQSHYLLIYTALVAIAVLIEAIALGALAFAAARLIKDLAVLTEEAKGKIYPLLATVHSISEKVNDISGTVKDVVNDTAPKVKHVTSQVVETSDIYRAKLAEVDAFVSDTTAKAKRQSDRVDGMITHVLTRSGEIAAHVQDAVMAPVRHISGAVAVARAGLDSVLHRFTQHQAPAPTPRPVAFEGESVYTGYEDDYHA